MSTNRNLLTIVLVVATFSGAGDATMAGAASPTLTVTGNGLSMAHLGTGESAAIARITRAIGRPTTHLSADPGLENCGVSATATWHSMIVFFNHNRLVGLSFGPGYVPTVKTAAGLRLGDTLSQARHLPKETRDVREPSGHLVRRDTVRANRRLLESERRTRASAQSSH